MEYSDHHPNVFVVVVVRVEWKRRPSDGEGKLCEKLGRDCLLTFGLGVFGGFSVRSSAPSVTSAARDEHAEGETPPHFFLLNPVWPVR
jgi:hypothetical protein